MKETDSINEYSNYPYLPSRIAPGLIRYPLNQPSDQEEYEYSLARYNDIVDQLYCYEVFEVESEDVVVIHFSYLKQHTSEAFPSSLVFRDIPDKIEYEINSKRTSDIKKGVLFISR